MIRKILTIVMVVGSILGRADILPETIDVALTGSYVPVGFDDNDRVQIVVEGVFPNTCWRVGPHALRIDDNTKTVQVQQQAYLYDGICLEVLVPFTQVIDVGLLRARDYTIVDNLSKKDLGVVQVLRSSNSGPDDYLYAPITDAYVMNDSQSKKNSLVMSGAFEDRCSEIQDVRVLYQNRVLVVQPIMKRNERGCEVGKTRFQKVVELKKEIHGLYLLHVRSLNGQAINRMIEFQ